MIIGRWYTIWGLQWITKQWTCYFTIDTIQLMIWVIKQILDTIVVKHLLGGIIIRKWVIMDVWEDIKKAI